MEITKKNCATKTTIVKRRHVIKRLVNRIYAMNLNAPVEPLPSDDNLKFKRDAAVVGKVNCQY